MATHLHLISNDMATTLQGPSLHFSIVGSRCYCRIEQLEWIATVVKVLGDVLAPLNTNVGACGNTTCLSSGFY